jgi:hypothetical protein
MWIRARALNVPKIYRVVSTIQRRLKHEKGRLAMYIRQLILQRRGGTAKARMQFHVQLAAVARDTALARTLAGNISDGYVQLVGPQVVAKEATKR